MKKDVSDVSSVEDSNDGDADMLDFGALPEFKREMLLAERHAEEIKLRQRQQLLQEGAKTRMPNLDSEFGSFLEEDSFDDLEEAEAERSVPLFGDDKGGAKRTEQKYVPVGLANSAKLSKTATLHILEHPNCFNYLKGALLKILVSPPGEGTTRETPGVLLPQLLGTHSVFRIEKLIKVEEYVVYGAAFADCDHELRDQLGRCCFIFSGSVLSEHANTDIKCRVTLNDICNAPFVQEDLVALEETMAQDLSHVTAVLKGFTFTDRDVELILERKLSGGPGSMTCPGSRARLISEIQQCSHEFELLSQASDSESRKEKIKELQDRKARLQSQLDALKGTKKEQAFTKNCAVLRADSLEASTLRKTTQPTPMILFSAGTKSIKKESDPVIGRKRKTRDLSVQDQKYLLKIYESHMNEYNIEKWELAPCRQRPQSSVP